MTDQDTEALDPAYLWILPRHLELTAKTKRILDGNPFGVGSDVKENFPYFLDVLSRPKAPRFRLLFIDYDKWNDKIQEARSIHPDTKGWKKSTLLAMASAIAAIQHVGLQFKGGINSLRTEINASSMASIMLSIIVTNPDEARKYIKLGVKVDKETLLHANPTTLEEAVANYALILKLTSPNGETISTPKELDKMIREAEDAKNAGKPGDIDHDSIIWCLKREKFRLQVKERYREVMIDMAFEERVEEATSCIRERKRRRLNGP